MKDYSSKTFKWISNFYKFVGLCDDERLRCKVFYLKFQFLQIFKADCDDERLQLKTFLTEFPMKQWFTETIAWPDCCIRINRHGSDKKCLTCYSDNVDVIQELSQVGEILTKLWHVPLQWSTQWTSTVLRTVRVECLTLWLPSAGDPDENFL